VRTSDLVFAYFSPETLVPATSIVATIAGVMMMLGRGSLRLLVRSAQQTPGRAGRVEGTSKPHLHTNSHIHTYSETH
jgi:hypothetical protein